MSAHRTEAGVERSNTIFTILASRQRRLVLELLADRHSSVDEVALATQLVARVDEVDRVDVTHEDRRRALVALRHEVLPALEEAGLVERRDGDITTTDHPLVGHPVVRRLVETDPPDDVLRALTDGRRRDLYAILAAAGRPVDRRTLARDVAAREYDVAPEAVPDREVDDVLTAFHHVHLPMLEDAGLFEYDCESGRVRYTGHPALEADALELDESVPVTASSA